MTLYDVPAPAKVNLFLHVVGRRPDGYHLLQTAFRFIDLCDTLHFEARADGVISRAAELPGVSEQDDLTLRAARALQQATGTRQGAQIEAVDHGVVHGIDLRTEHVVLADRVSLHETLGLQVLQDAQRGGHVQLRRLGDVGQALDAPVRQAGEDAADLFRGGNQACIR